ncbi:hypothetical protein JST97_17990 [bacterium]|nr:hypothetical protein [bacterium]
MSGSDLESNKPEPDEKLEEDLRSTRKSIKNLSDKSRQLQEQLLQLEKKLWGRKPDETVAT